MHKDKNETVVYFYALRVFSVQFQIRHQITILAMGHHYCYVINPPLLSSHTEEPRVTSCPFALDIDEARVKRCGCSEIEETLDPSASKEAVEWGRITWGQGLGREESCLPLCQFGYWALTMLQFTADPP